MLNPTDRRIRIIVGHYGSGKTEFAVNYAVRLASHHKKVALVDLDVVNPYFRSREKAAELKQAGVRVIASSLQSSAADLPALSAEIYSPLQDESWNLIIDSGGDPAGAKTLGRFAQYFSNGHYDMFLVLNANRPETSGPLKAVAYAKAIERASRAKITGIINNTHLVKSTTGDDILNGQELAKAVSRQLKIPIIYVSVMESLIPSLPDSIKEKVFPLKLYMREEWMS